ncbi:cupin domain-containing protein [Nitrospira sp. T9]
MAEEIVHHTLYTGWRELHEFPGTGEVKVLREESNRGAKTIVVRLPAGGQILPHNHLGVVQHFVIEGQYETQGKTFEPGSYRLFPTNAEVAKISTKNGVTIMMIYDPVESEPKN